ncbi:hypothetical protein B0T14DRAFT_268200 [Immersiella caudata]|uniref:Uncharacterized protein n=1 Tax=Immersiella caudata TaxID=314043 RepID=A0AA39WL36_9PEZI|nr:hypothetical protein B0T14DRAFT_268200 [Immersiella caudata]
MALHPTPSRLRPSTLCLDLEGVFLSGTLNSFKNAQLVLKSQYGPAPRTPYTGSQSQAPEVRHLLMVHVNDRANELETLDLAQFALPPDSQDESMPHKVEYLAAESSLAFYYPKGASKAQHTLKVKFQGPADIVTVLTELWALNITVQNASPSIQGNLSTNRDVRGFASPSTHYPTSRYQTPRQAHGRSSRLAMQPNTPDWRSPLFANPAHRLTPSRPLSQTASQSMSPVNVWPSISPVHQLPRPATTVGVPGVLGEGVYRIRRMSSAPGSRPRMREPLGTFELHDPRAYTVSRYFDKTLERSDIAHLFGGRSVQDEGTPEARDLKDSASVADVVRNSANNGLSSLQFYQGPDAMPRDTRTSQKVIAAAQESRQGAADDALLRVASLSQDGLMEATKIWNDLLEMGQKEAELVCNAEEAQKIWSRYGQDWERQLIRLAANVAEKMRSEGVHIC